MEVQIQEDADIEAAIPEAPSMSAPESENAHLFPEGFRHFAAHSEAMGIPDHGISHEDEP